MDVLIRQLTKDEIKQLTDEKGRLEVVVGASLDDIIICYGIDEFNDLIEGKISDEFIMADIEYKIVGADPENDEVLIKVNCEPIFTDNEDD